MTDKDLRKAYYPNYFSIDAILACQTLVPCRTEMRLPKFGFLVPDCNSEDLPVGVNFQLPLWAARVLSRPGKTYVSVNIPPGFKDVHKGVIDEDPSAVNLRKVHSQYFEAGHLCTSLFHNDAGELAEMLPEILQQRLLCIGEAALTVPPSPWIHSSEGNKKIDNELLDILEQKHFDDAKRGALEIEEWLKPMAAPPKPKPAPAPPQQQSHPVQQQLQHHQQQSHIQPQQQQIRSNPQQIRSNPQQIQPNPQQIQPNPQQIQPNQQINYQQQQIHQPQPIHPYAQQHQQYHNPQQHQQVHQQQQYNNMNVAPPGGIVHGHYPHNMI